ncbi:antithrombin-III [Astyanax mexicanus]|uniref:Antithrombin-III n=1 Tax=Astyanax mexicanus TaxID=7994 RepID=A0A8B9LA55_ASTMX|nr:antithrombin-III [Astyanax mexicanus]
MKLWTCLGALWILSICSVQAAVDICSAKPKDLPLQPVCIYRNPNVHDHEAAPTEKPAVKVLEKASEKAHGKMLEKIPESTNPRVYELSKANGRFALSLFKQLSKGKPHEENIFMSPLSISTAFAMTKLGACNSTLEQIMKVFEFDTIKEKTSDQVHFFFAKLNCRLYRKKHNTVELVSANRLFGEQSLNINENFQNISEVVYGAKLMPLNFKEKPEISRLKINQWISEKTKGKINDTLPQGSIDATAVMVLVNTIYFKGQWKNKFDKKDVMSLQFHVSSTKKCQVHMMYKEAKFQYKKFPEDKVKVLELPYNGGGISMVLVLPMKDSNLTEVEKIITHSKLTNWTNTMSETTVAVQIPRFRIEDSFSLKEKMRDMGLNHLFSAEHASLPGIVEGVDNGIYISDAYHKAFLEVNEEGSEAAAATAVVALGRSLNVNRESFVANKPFLLFIREATINTIIFAGRISNPCKSG